MSFLTPMRAAQTIRIAACVGLGVWNATAQLPAAPGQRVTASTLPTQAPTAASAATTAASAATAAANPATNVPTRPRETRLEVVLVDRSLIVRAENASLNQVLREISQKTGVKISGSAGEEKVFGSYGPASTAVVLSSLLEGTGSNVLLVDNHTGPQELTLTPRGGRATAPTQTASGPQNTPNESQEQEQPYVAPVQAFRPPVATGRGPVGSNADGSPAFNQPADDTDGSGVTGGGQQKTPQQIYEQLQSLSNQQQQQTPPE